MDKYALLFYILLFLIIENICFYFILKNKFKNDIKNLNLKNDSQKFYDKNVLLEKEKTKSLSQNDLVSFEIIRKEQKKLDAEFRRKMKIRNDISK